MEKRGAIELSIGTIVIIVLAMSMLILGMVLIKNIFGGATQNVLSMNSKVEDQINKLFVEDKRTVVYLPNQIAKIEQNEEWGVAFGIKNLVRNTALPRRFRYNVIVADDDVRTKCGIDERTIESWMITGRSGEITIAPGEAYTSVVRFFIPENSPLCTVRFHLIVTDLEAEAGVIEGNYYTDFFDIEVLA